jgi:D-glycero-D-manno-heptose 1,7-bisphosphate phosphatase
MSRPAVFLDRDGTIIEDAGYLSDPAAMVLLPRSAAAIRRLKAAGFLVMVVTNQAGVARGLFAEGAVQEVHAALQAALAPEGAAIDAFYYCPHHPEGSVDAYRRRCECRKPAAGMLHAAAREHDVDLQRSWMVGDKPLDVEAGLAAGCRSIQVRTGAGARHDTATLGSVSVSVTAGAAVGADAILNNLMEAAEWILLSSSR